MRLSLTRPRLGLNPAWASRRGAGPEGAAPRLPDLDALAESVVREVNMDRRATAFLTYLRASGVTGEVPVAYLEARYWQVMGAPATTEKKWARAWRSMSRALSKSCYRRQIRDGIGRRRHVLMIPNLTEVPKD